MGSKHANKDSKTDLLIELFKNGKTDGEIHEITGLDPKWIDFVLKRESLRQKSTQYTSKITSEISAKILEMHGKGNTATETAREIGITATGVASFIKKRGLKPSLAAKRDQSRRCQGPGCDVRFSPKFNDGPSKSHSTTCSEKCRRAKISVNNTKYTQDQIDEVVELRKQSTSRLTITDLTGVNVNKIKKIIGDNNLYLTQEQKNKNSGDGIRAYWADPTNARPIKEWARSPEALEILKADLLERDYEYVSGFVTRSRPFVIKHLKCKNIRSTSHIHTVFKGKCEYCAAKDAESAGEREVREWFKELGHKGDKYFFHQGRRGSEIDVHSSDLNFGVEYCGLYWHSNWGGSKDPQNRHKIKLEKAENRGIRLITLYEDEWQTRKEQVKSYIATFLMAGDHSAIFNKSSLEPINDDRCSSFLIENDHVVGGIEGTRFFGLFNGKEMIGVSCISMSKSSIIINKICLKMGLSIRQGFDHIVTRMVEYASQEGFKKVEYTSDSRWAKGNSMTGLGFALIEEIPPRPEYGSGAKRVDPNIFTEEFLTFKGAEGETLEERIESSGHYTIWDCGRKKWELKIK